MPISSARKVPCTALGLVARVEDCAVAEAARQLSALDQRWRENSAYLMAQVERLRAYALSVLAVFEGLEWDPDCTCCAAARKQIVARLLRAQRDFQQTAGPSEKGVDRGSTSGNDPAGAGRDEVS